MAFLRFAPAGRCLIAGLLGTSGLLQAQTIPPSDNRAPVGTVGSGIRSGVELHTGASRSDNIERVPTAKSSDTIVTIGSTLDFARDGRFYDAEVLGEIDWTNYLDNSFESRVLGNVNAVLNADFVPDRFSWFAQETFGQLRTDPFSPVTPDTLENVSYFTTGPRLQIGLGSSGRLVLAGTYSLAEYEKTNLDTDRYGGSIAVIRALSHISSISLNFINERLEFDEMVAADYDRRSAYLQYTIQGARTAVTADAGYSQVSGVGDDQSGVLARLSAERLVSPSTRISLFAMDQISDSVDVFRSDAATRSITRPLNGISTASAMEERGYGLGWVFSRARTNFSFSASRKEELYDLVSELDRKVTSLQFSFVRRLGPITTLALDVRYDDEEFDNVNFDDQELEARAELRWALGRRLGAGLRFERFDRDSNNPATEYVENRVGLNVYWQAIGEQAE
ncbi:MAG: outer membrane beta-barrel protein [Steroidobacteraceae bacterium]|nr:outer membrane beta-barrel protein [Steroidobacteraceae bacterium]